MTTMKIQATVTLALKGQRVAKVALADSEVPDQGGLGGNSKVVPIQNWDQLKLSLPPGLQNKIGKAKQQQRRQQERVQLHQQRKKQRLRSPVEPISLVPEPSQQKLPLKLIETQGPVQERTVTEGEQQEFDCWYRFAQGCKLVTDYSWRDGEYWVLTEEQWQPYAEIAAVFTLKSMNRMFGISMDIESERGD
ncbi:hypothetical protein [Acaryochloris sp. 'Moss Beach']|uniref:hypothetical protein n=1 Tax=Acaryochloris sp. 'Moss Beach' TaxID=2740837 RepID=UPI001F2D126A|nr:hypothetical protein [Acaryochloris sp. 'Moss Beach']